MTPSVYLFVLIMTKRLHISLLLMVGPAPHWPCITLTDLVVCPPTARGLSIRDEHPPMLLYEYSNASLTLYIPL